MSVMELAFFSTKPYDRRFFEAAVADASSDAGPPHRLVFFEPRLTVDTAPLAKGFGGVCVFVNDPLDAEVLERLAAQGNRLIALRCAGYNNVDLAAAKRLGLTVARVPVYSPYAVAEHTMALILALNRKVHRAYNRVREGNFAIDGLLGFDLHDKTVGLVGTGRIGRIMAKICAGFGCRVLAYDRETHPDCEKMGVQYVGFDELVGAADVLSLHCPLTPDTHHLIDADVVARLKPGVMIVNTSRGGLIDASALIDGLKSGRVGSVALDVYEEEGDVFFEDLSNNVLQDDVLARLLTFPNVLITSHQAFFTQEAMRKIAQTTLANVTGFERGTLDKANVVSA